jgi:hypothetical protein
VSTDSLETADTQVVRQTDRRILTPVILILAGVAMLIYGSAFHSATVLTEKKADPGDSAIRHAPETKHIQLSEAVMTRDITIGGLVRLDSGLIKRTYAGDKPPASVCPT